MNSESRSQWRTGKNEKISAKKEKMRKPGENYGKRASTYV